MKISRTDAGYISSNGQTLIHTSIWKNDDDAPKALLQIAHGVSEHIMRYDDFATYMAAHGYLVFGNDHLGHGESISDDVCFGFFAENDGDKRLVDDMHILSLIMKKRYPNLSLIILGHSMGSLCARVYAASFPNDFDAMILCGTMELPESIILLESPLRRLSKRLGEKTILNSNLFDKIMTFGIKNKQSIKDWLSLSQSNVNEYINDPLCGKALTIQGAVDILSLAGSSCSNAWYKRISKNIKLMIIAGANDPIGFSGRGITALCDNLDDVEIDYEVRVYPTFRHEILNEDDNFEVYKDILKWCDAQISE